MRTLHLAFVIVLASGVAACSSASNSDPEPFTTDACSAFPEGTSEQQTLWLHCCTEHDVAYWQGGTSDQRRAADETLKQCVAATGEPEIAKLMLAGVRIGGTPYLPTSFRWGYGWPWPRGYKALDEIERAAVARALDDFRKSSPDPGQ